MHPRKLSPAPVLLILLGLFAYRGYAQTGEAHYLSSTLEITSKKNAAYYRVPNGQRDGLFIGSTFTVDGKLKAEGPYLDQQLRVEHGEFRFFHANGRVESQGTYINGRKSGVWERFNEAGERLAEKVYDHEPLLNIVYTLAQEMPRYAEGDERALQKYIKSRAVPEGAKRTKANLTATFVVERSGVLTDVRVVGGKDPALDKRVVDALLSTSPWVPGLDKGQPVRVLMRVPVSF